jgi:hypothetical protein
LEHRRKPPPEWRTHRAAARAVSGEINDAQKAAWCQTIGAFDEGSHHTRQIAMFPEDRMAPALDCDVVHVRLSEQRLNRPRQWGACWLAGEKALAPGLTPRAVLDKMAAIQMVDVHLPTIDRRTVVLARYTEPEPDQAVLLQQMKMHLPAQPPAVPCHLSASRQHAQLPIRDHHTDLATDQPPRHAVMVGVHLDAALGRYPAHRRTRFRQ